MRCRDYRLRSLALSRGLIGASPWATTEHYQIHSEQSMADTEGLPNLQYGGIAITKRVKIYTIDLERDTVTERINPPEPPSV